MRVSKNNDGIIIPNNHQFPFIKIANKDGDASMLNDPRYSVLGSNQDGSDFHCCTKFCSKMPQTVCKECNEYICEDHLFRHPNCQEGR